MTSGVPDVLPAGVFTKADRVAFRLALKLLKYHAAMAERLRKNHSAASVSAMDRHQDTYVVYANLVNALREISNRTQGG